MDYNKQTIPINRDLLIEIHHNPNLSNNPYQLRIYDWQGYTEHRLNFTDMLNLAESIADFAFDNSNSIVYNNQSRGLYRLLEYKKEQDNE